MEFHHPLCTSIILTQSWLQGPYDLVKFFSRFHDLGLTFGNTVLKSRGKYFYKFLKLFPPTRKILPQPFVICKGKTCRTFSECMQKLWKICFILQILLFYLLSHPKTLPKMVNFLKMFPPTLAGIKRNIYPWLEKIKCL